MPKLKNIAPVINYANTDIVRFPPKTADPQYLTPEFRAWRTMVVARAGGRCQAIDPYGHRCSRAAPLHRMYADHIIELKDDGALLDPLNGMCLCASHHEIKTRDARARRLKSKPLAVKRQDGH